MPFVQRRLPILTDYNTHLVWRFRIRFYANGVIATGNAVKDKHGKVIKFETVEAHDTDEGSETQWRTVSKKYTIGHPFRSSDVGRNITQTLYGDISLPTSTRPSADARTRTADNLQQTAVADPSTKSK